jgi:hypothetical protein
MEVDAGACLRVPAISQSVPLEAEKRVVVVTGFGLVGNPDVSGFRGVIDFNGGAGGWVGPALLTGQIGAGFSLCNEGTCGRDRDGSLRSDFTVPLSVDARFVFGTATVNRLFNVGLVGARYSFVPVRLPVTDGSERRFVTHAFQGVLAWGFNENHVKGPLRHLERSIPFELAVPLGVLVDQGAPNHGVVFAGGIEIRMFFHL